MLVLLCVLLQPPEFDDYGNWLEPSSFESFDPDSAAEEVRRLGYRGRPCRDALRSCGRRTAPCGWEGQPAACRVPRSAALPVGAPNPLGPRLLTTRLQAAPFGLSDSDDEARQAFQEGLAASALGQEWSFGPGADPEASWTGGGGDQINHCIGLDSAALSCLAHAACYLSLCIPPFPSRRVHQCLTSHHLEPSPYLQNLQGVAEALVEALRRAGGGTVVMCDTEANQLDVKRLLLFHQTCAAHSGMCVCLGMACVNKPA